MDKKTIDAIAILQRRFPGAVVELNEFGQFDVKVFDEYEEVTDTYVLEGNTFRYIGCVTCEV